MKKETPKATKAPRKTSAELPVSADVVQRICDRAFFMALQMIDIANSREVKEKAEPKVGGHPSACASSQHILGTIHLLLRQPEDYFACKPHVSPIDHAFNYLLHLFREKDGSEMPADRRELAMHHLRHYSHTGDPVFQSYHAEVDPDGYRYFPSGSVGIPPVNALYMSLAYRYAEDHGYDLGEKPTFWCLMGDSEFREGSLMEAMPDAGERELNNLVWIVDYNRQNLDGTRATNEKALEGTDADRIVRLAAANGWNAVKLKHGKLRQKMFATEGGDEFRRVLDEELTDFEFQALLGSNQPKLVRERLATKSKALGKWMESYSDDELFKAFINLAGHDVECLYEVFSEAKQSEKPTLVVAYTIKGIGLECQALSGNHSAMPEKEELERVAKRFGTSTKNPFAEFDASSKEEKFLVQRRKELGAGIDRVVAAAKKRREAYVAEASQVQWPGDFDIGALKYAPLAHTQWMWGQIAAKLDRLARGEAEVTTDNDRAWKNVAKFFVTMAPDVGSSTNTSPNMNGKLYGDIRQEDFEKTYGAKDQKAPDVIPHANEKTGHLRFEIAEGNCMSAAGSFGKFRHFVGVPFYPAMPIYDFFIKRAHDQFYYNLYWHSSFATIGTPSGITLAPEGAQHSWKSDFQIPNCITWEPAFAKELDWILADTLRRHFTMDDEAREAALIRCVTKGLVQKDLLDRLRRQVRFQENGEAIADDQILETIRQHTLEGGYTLIDYRGYEGYLPGDNVIHLFAMGALVTEAIRASDALYENGIFANVYVVTSPDLLLGNFAEANGYQHLKQTLGIEGNLYFTPDRGKSLESRADWLYLRGSRIPVVSVHDGEPGLLDNIGSVVGTVQKTLAVRKTSKSGTTWDIFHYHGLDAEGIVGACEKILEEMPQERLQLSTQLAEQLEAEDTGHSANGSHTNGHHYIDN